MRRSLRACLAALGLGSLVACGADAPELPAQPAALPLPAGRASVSITRIGPRDVDRSGRIELPEAVVDVAGEAWNVTPDGVVAVFYRLLGASQWTVTEASPVERGGAYLVGAVRFPGHGEYEVLAKLLSARAAGGDGGAPAVRPESPARAVSVKLLVKVDAPPEPLDGERPPRAVVQVGGAVLQPQRATLVPSQGDVVLRAREVQPRAEVYLAMVAHSSGHACLVGPARGTAPEQYLLPAVALRVPGDPRSVDLDLFAVVSPRALPTGPTNLAWLRRQEAVTSLSSEVVVDAADRLLVPQIAIDRIGKLVVSAQQAGGQALPAANGDPAEVEQTAGATIGQQLWLLTRPVAGGRWLAQGPAMLRGLPPAGAPGPAPAAVWVWPSLRFERDEAGKPAQPGEEAGARSQPGDDFEVAAVLTTTPLPRGWLDPSRLAGESVSASVRVHADAAMPAVLKRISIARIGATDVDPAGGTAQQEIVVGATEPIEVEVESELPPASRVYLAWHRTGDFSWTLAEAVPGGRAYTVPAVSFGGAEPRRVAHYELLAIVTRGETPAEVDTGDLARSLLVRSDLVQVRYEPPPASFAAWLGGPWSVPEETAGEAPATATAGAEGWSRPMWISFLPWIVLIGVLAAFALLEWRRGFVEPLARRAARRLDRAAPALAARLAGFPPTRPALFLLGVAVGALLLFAIAHFYLPLYARAVAVVTGLPRRESEGLAVWLILLTALTGIFLELTSDAEHGVVRKGWLALALGMCLAFVLCCLAVFQALFYYSFLSKAGLVAILGAIAFFLIAFVEALSFFFVSRLTLHQLEPMFIRCVRLLLVLLALLCHAAARFMHEIARGKPKREEPE